METSFCEIINGSAIAREKIPHLSFDEFRKQALKIVEAGGKVVQFSAILTAKQTS